MNSHFFVHLYQIYANKIRIVMSSDEPVDIRTKRLLYDEAREKKDDDLDSDDELLKGFDNVTEPVMPNSSIGSLVYYTHCPSVEIQSSLTAAAPGQPAKKKLRTSRPVIIMFIQSRTSASGKGKTKESYMLVDK